MRRKLLSVILALCLVLGMVPAVYAEEGEVSNSTELLSAIEVGGNVKLMQNIDLQSGMSISKSVSLDLNGYTLDLGEGQYGIQLGSDVTFTLKDSGNGGVLKFCGTSRSNRTAIYSSGSSPTINIEGGTVEMTSSSTTSFYAVRSLGAINISGGTVKAYRDNTNGKPIAIGAQGSSLNITGGAIIAQVSPKSDGSHAGGIGIEFKTASTCNAAIADDVTFDCTLSDIDAQNTINVTGGTFTNIQFSKSAANGSSLTNCTINGAIALSGYECTFDNVEFGPAAVLSSTRYVLSEGKVLPSSSPKIIFASSSGSMGLVKIDRYEFSDPSSSGAYSEPMESKTWYVNSGSTATVTATAVPADENHEFVGWYDTNSTSGKKLSDEETVTYTALEGGVTAGITYYAVFQETQAFSEMKTAAQQWAGASAPTISSITEMNYFAFAVNELGYDFSGKTVTLSNSLTYGDEASFTPIGTQAHPFNGSFDGGSNTITGLSAKGTYSMEDTGSYLGLFGYTNGAQIINLTLNSVNFHGAYMAGGFAGEANNTTFTNCTLTGSSTISYSYYVGGLFGHSSVSCTVTGCKVENSVLDGPWKTGGIVGYVNGITISNVTVTDTRVEGSASGALIGHANDGDTVLTNVTVASVTDGEQQKIYMVGTNYAGGTEHSITISGEQTAVDAAGFLPSTEEGVITVSGGSYTFAVPNDQLETDKISVTFQNEGKIVIVRVVAKGGTAALPDAPAKDNYFFAGWYLGDGTAPVTAGTTFDASTLVLAKWADEAIALSPSNLTIFVGSTAQLTATVLPVSLTGSEITWTSADEEIATVANGEVTGVKAGSTTITASVGNYSASCTVLVTGDSSEVVPAVGESVPTVDSSIASEDISTATETAGSAQAASTIIEAAQEEAAELAEDDEQKQAFVNEGNTKLSPDEGESVSLYTQTFLTVAATSLTKNENNSIISITLNITPMVQVVASTAKNSANIVIGNGGDGSVNAVIVQPARELAITTPAEITVKLPESFGNQIVYVKHIAKNGKVYYYQATASANGHLTFLSKHGFSPFTFSLNNDAVAEVGEIGYDSFEEAVNAAKNGETVIVRKKSDFSANVTGSSRTITIRNETEAEIIVTLNGTELTIPANDSKNYTYTRSSSTSSEPSLGTPLPPASETEEPSASSGFESDTTSDFTVDGAYQFRITSLDGTAPVMTASNANFRVELASREGNDYFFKIYAQGAPGSTAVISVNGTAILTATVGGSASGVISDTTHPFTVAQGGTYQFRLTASERPDFAAGSPSFTVEYAGQIGSDYFFKVHAVGKPGDGCGFYINKESAPVAVATIA